MRIMGIVAAMLSIASGAAAVTYVVDPGGGGDFLTIQAAVDAVADGDVIEVMPGVYVENIRFGNPLPSVSLIGVEGAAGTIIDGGGSGKCIDLMDFSNASQGRISGFTIRGSGSGYSDGRYNCGIYVHTGGMGDWELDHCVFTDHPNCAILSTDTGSIHHDLFLVGGWGIWVSDGGEGHISSNTFIGCEEAVVVHYQASSLAVDHCLVYDAFNGIRSDPAVPTITDCNGFWLVGTPYLDCGPGAHDVFADPQFCGNPPDGNYGLQSDSPMRAEANPDCGTIGAYDVICGEDAAAVSSWGTLKSRY